jgi:ribosomal protein S18 acetylase RimI-like enzyme
MYISKASRRSGDMSGLDRILRIIPVKKSEHLLFNLYNFNFFRRSEHGDAIMFSEDSRLLTLLMALPYILGCELAFFGDARYFVRLKEQMAGVLVLRRKPYALFIGSLAVAPEYRRCGLAIYMLDYSAIVGRRLGRSWLELTVLKKNTSARQLYEKAGLVRKKEGKWSFVLRKSIDNAENSFGSGG